MKEFWRSKTFWFNVLAIVVAVAGVFGFAEFEPTPEMGQVIGIIVAVINMVLRFLTSEGITLKKAS